MNEPRATLSVDTIEGLIHPIRGIKVLLDRDLALLYGVETRSLVQAVKRNIGRFPADFMFKLTPEEFENLRSQLVISSPNCSRSQIVILKRGQNIKYLPYAFTEHGVAMLSSVLRSAKAVTINIEIIRAFIRLRHLLSNPNETAREMAELKSFLLKHSHANDREFRRLWDAFEQLAKPQVPSRRIGFDLGP